MGGIVKFDENADPKTYQVNSSVTTVFSLINSMIGGTMLLLPSLFSEAGIIVSEIILLISGYISYKTVVLYATHMKDNEIDMQYIVKRILGK